LPFAGVSQTVPAACYCAGLVRGPDLVLFSLRHFLATFTTGAGTGNHSRLSPRRFAGDYCWRYGVKRASTKTRVSQHGERRLPSTMAGKISTLASLAGSNKAAANTCRPQSQSTSNGRLPSSPQTGSPHKRSRLVREIFLSVCSWSPRNSHSTGLEAGVLQSLPAKPRLVRDWAAEE